MGFDAVFRSAASVVLGIVGTPATLRRRVEASYVPETGAASPIVPVDYSVTISPPQPWTQDAGGETGPPTITDDFQCMLAGADISVTPVPLTDSIVFGGTEYSIQQVYPTYSGALVAYFTLRLRK